MTAIIHSEQKYAAFYPVSLSPAFTGFEKNSGAFEMIACDGDEKRRLGLDVAKIYVGAWLDESS